MLTNEKYILMTLQKYEIGIEYLNYEIRSLKICENSPCRSKKLITNKISIDNIEQKLLIYE